MKKVLKVIGIIIGAIILIAVVGGLYINIKGIPSYEVESLKFAANSTPEAIERGKKLTTMLCASCHMNQQTGKLSGTQMLDAPPEFGTIYSANITQDKTYGIGEWTDGEILYLLRTGIKKDGKYAPPYMAKLPNMADEDLNAIIAFLRSDDPLVSPDPTPDPPSQPSFLTKILCNVAWKPFPFPKEKIPMPDTTDAIALGKYLAHNLDCFTCHSADFKTIDFLEPEKSVGYFGGGNKPLDKKGQVILLANLTPHETGIANWSEEQFLNAVKYGIKKGEPTLRYPMAPYSGLADKEVNAIFQYLKTVPPIDNKIERQFYD